MPPCRRAGEVVLVEADNRARTPAFRRRRGRTRRHLMTVAPHRRDRWCPDRDDTFVVRILECVAQLGRRPSLFSGTSTYPAAGTARYTSSSVASWWQRWRRRSPRDSPSRCSARPAPAAVPGLCVCQSHIAAHHRDRVFVSTVTARRAVGEGVHGAPLIVCSPTYAGAWSGQYSNHRVPGDRVWARCDCALTVPYFQY